MRKLFQLAKENYCVRSMKTVMKLDNIDKKLMRDDFLKAIESFKSNKKESSGRNRFNKLKFDPYFSLLLLERVSSKFQGVVLTQLL